MTDSITALTPDGTFTPSRPQPQGGTCPICGRVITSGLYLRMHMATLHPTPEQRRLQAAMARLMLAYYWQGQGDGER